MFTWIRGLMAGFKTWEAFCFKCQRKRKIDNLRTKILQNGRETRQGNCYYCGTHISLISGHRVRKA